LGLKVNSNQARPLVPTGVGLKSDFLAGKGYIQLLNFFCNPEVCAEHLSGKSLQFLQVEAGWNGRY